MTQTILSVDDEPHMLKLLERIITEKTAYRITTTNNSLEVPELLKQNTYDLILADLKMPPQRAARPFGRAAQRTL